MRMAMLGLGDRPEPDELIEINLQTEYGEMVVRRASRARVVLYRGQYYLEVLDAIPLGPSVDDAVAREVEALLEAWGEIRIPEMIPIKEAA